MPRPMGYEPSEETRAKISASQRRGGNRKGKGWIQQLAPEYQALYRELYNKGATREDLRRMIIDHIAVVERRKRLANGSA